MLAAEGLPNGAEEGDGRDGGVGGGRRRDGGNEKMRKCESARRVLVKRWERGSESSFPSRRTSSDKQDSDRGCWQLIAKRGEGAARRAHGPPHSAEDLAEAVEIEDAREGFFLHDCVGEG